jgi:hypothetical protein
VSSICGEEPQANKAPKSADLPSAKSTLPAATGSSTPVQTEVKPSSPIPEKASGAKQPGQLRPMDQDDWDFWPTREKKKKKEKGKDARHVCHELNTAQASAPCTIRDLKTDLSPYPPTTFKEDLANGHDFGWNRCEPPLATVKGEAAMVDPLAPTNKQSLKQTTQTNLAQKPSKSKKVPEVKEQY